MWPKIKQLFSETLVTRLTKTFGAAMLGFAVVGLWKWSSLPPQLPLFYSLPRSTEQLGTPVTLLLLPTLSLLFFIINFLIAAVIYNRKRLAAMLLVITATVVSFLLLVTYIKIVFLVT